MSSLIEIINDKCREAVLTCFKVLNSSDLNNIISVTAATNKKFGHYQFNGAMKLTKIVKKSPQEIANQIVDCLHTIDSEMFTKIAIAGPGFINFTVAEGFLTTRLHKLLEGNWGLTSYGSRKVLIDFSSPNIAKEMHVGHLRSTVIGDCLSRILEFVGHDVLKINHLGDWGTQFGMLIAYLKRKQVVDDFADISLSSLVKYYKQAKQLFDQDAKFKVVAQQEVVKLQAEEPLSMQIWQKLCKISALAYQEIYDVLGVEIIDRGESFYRDLLANIIADFQSKGMLVDSDGAKCLYLEGYVNREGEPLPLMIQKSDGGYNYATTDLAAIKYRVNQEHRDWLIYVTDAGQSLHFNMVFAAAKKIGYCDNVELSHVPFGFVLREDGKKFKTREGDTERLIDLLNTAVDKAKQIVQAREPDLAAADVEQIAQKLGVNAIKYADLSNNRNSDYRFSYDKMLQFEGNTAAFLSYAYVRIQSIKEKSKVDIQKLLATGKIELAHELEIELALELCKFGDAIAICVKELMPNRLTDYLYGLAEKFHAFFHQCRVCGVKEQDSRLLLCEATGRVLLQGFKLLGLEPLMVM